MKKFIHRKLAYDYYPDSRVTHEKNGKFLKLWLKSAGRDICFSKLVLAIFFYLKYIINTV